MIKLIYSDLLTSDADIIAHQVNCLGLMGTGLALQIRNKYPRVFERYRMFCKQNNFSRTLLGKVQVIETNGKFIANVFAQYSVSRNLVMTNYSALRTAMQGLHDVAKKRNLSIAVPYNLGCGNAGGNWHTVLSILQKIFNDDVTLYIHRV